MTEIPEHLLKRSKERRAAIGGEEASEEAAAPSSEAVEAAPAEAPAAAPAAPVEVAPPAPEPDRPEVAAAKARKKMPVWAVPVILALPLWAYLYHGTLEPPPAGENDPFVLGEEVYAGCSSCHGANGGGGSGPPLDSVLETFPDPLDHMMWVRIGAPGWQEYSGEDTYGATDKPSTGLMPAHPDLDDQHLAQVVLYERAAFDELDPTSDEYLLLVEIAEGRLTFADAGLGELSAAIGVPESELEHG